MITFRQPRPGSRRLPGDVAVIARWFGVGEREEVMTDSSAADARVILDDRRCRPVPERYPDIMFDLPDMTRTCAVVRRSEARERASPRMSMSVGKPRRSLPTADRLGEAWETILFARAAWAYSERPIPTP